MLWTIFRITCVGCMGFIRAMHLLPCSNCERDPLSSTIHACVLFHAPTTHHPYMCTVPALTVKGTTIIHHTATLFDRKFYWSYRSFLGSLVWAIWTLSMPCTYVSSPTGKGTHHLWMRTVFAPTTKGITIHHIAHHRWLWYDLLRKSKHWRVFKWSHNIICWDNTQLWAYSKAQRPDYWPATDPISTHSGWLGTGGGLAVISIFLTSDKVGLEY